VRAALVEAREASRMTLEHEVRAVIAERYAELVDRASSEGDGAAVTRHGDKLLAVLDQLPVRKPADPAGGGDSGGGDGERGRVLSLLDGEPTVGDSAHA
jgi:hypothetical protein